MIENLLTTPTMLFLLELLYIIAVSLIILKYKISAIKTPALLAVPLFGRFLISFMDYKRNENIKIDQIIEIENLKKLLEKTVERVEILEAEKITSQQILEKSQHAIIETGLTNTQIDILILILGTLFCFFYYQHLQSLIEVPIRVLPDISEDSLGSELDSSSTMDDKPEINPSLNRFSNQINTNLNIESSEINTNLNIETSEINTNLNIETSEINENINIESNQINENINQNRNISEDLNEYIFAPDFWSRF